MGGVSSSTSVRPAAALSVENSSASRRPPGPVTRSPIWHSTGTVDSFCIAVRSLNAVTPPCQPGVSSCTPSVSKWTGSRTCSRTPPCTPGTFVLRAIRFRPGCRKPDTSASRKNESWAPSATNRPLIQISSSGALRTRSTARWPGPDLWSRKAAPEPERASRSYRLVGKITEVVRGCGRRRHTLRPGHKRRPRLRPGLTTPDAAPASGGSASNNAAPRNRLMPAPLRNGTQASPAPPRPFRP